MKQKPKITNHRYKKEHAEPSKPVKTEVVHEERKAEEAQVFTSDKFTDLPIN